MTTAISELAIGPRPSRGEQTAGSPAGTKLAIPLASVPLLHRPRISSLLQKALTSRIAVVRGPGGAGKTVACAMWAAAQPDSERPGWVSLDPGDRAPERLWAAVSEALAGTAEGPLLAIDPADQAYPLLLAQAAQRLPRPVTLVIDDVQELAGSPAAAALDLLVRHGPPQLRLLLAGRHLSGLGLARLQVGGEFAELDASDLACSPSEARDYFEMLGVELLPEQVDHLLERTQGWIAGLRLAALRTWPGLASPPGPSGPSGPADPAGPIGPARIRGDDPLVADYLRDEVLGDLPADRRDFLLRTSVPDRICGDLADALTGGSTGTAILDQLCRENLMLTPADDWTAAAQPTGAGLAEYRYHPLLLDLLRAELRRDLPGELAPLAGLAARWQSAHGQPGAALRHAVQAGDWDLAAGVLAEAGPELLLADRAAELEPVLAMFPASRHASDAAVAGALAAAGLRIGDDYAAQLHLDHALTALPDCQAGQRQVVGIWLDALRLMHALGQGSTDQVLTQDARKAATQAAASATTGAWHQAAGLLWTAVAVADLASLRIADAREAAAYACRQLDAGGQPGFLAQAQAWRAIAEALYGDLLTASDLLAGPTMTTVTDPLASWLTDIASAFLHLAKDETAAARRLLERGDARGGTGYGCGYGRSVAASLASLAEARLALCDGDQGAARRQLTRLRYASARAGAAGSGQLHGGLAVLDADIALREGDAAGARLALTRAGEAERDRGDLLVGSAKVLLAEGDSKSALATAQTCLTGAAGQVTLGDQVGALVAAAVAHRRLGQPDQAADQLGYALALAEPHGMYRPFLDGGQPARSALTVLIRPAHQGAAVAARILQRFDTRPVRSADLPATVPLTGSELAVLRFLPSHMTNQEIAEALFLSINTVKTHLRSVYRKLGVTTRRQAISAAGRLGLLLSAAIGRPPARLAPSPGYPDAIMRRFVLILSSRSGT
ncbi:MAG TPA: LuxR C-terminal-related transcriptional regulator [Streptosporangiaceae bacterium]|nr:LuxR C-terminal-related transcriptional regulator [Streptosporangiaceae bacterium]